jgi:hypothetical protein
MGCSNTQWITEDYQFLSHFDEIVLLFDNDLAGKKAAKDAAARLGQERCLIVTLPLKDANDMLRANRGKEIGSIIENTTPEPIAEIVNPSSMIEKVKSVCIDNTYWKESIIEGPFTIGKIYDITFANEKEWCWVVTDYDRMGHYPSKMFKSLDEVRNEHLELILG